MFLVERILKWRVITYICGVFHGDHSLEGAGDASPSELTRGENSITEQELDEQVGDLLLLRQTEQPGTGRETSYTLFESDAQVTHHLNPTYHRELCEDYSLQYQWLCKNCTWTSRTENCR
ncbi:hypothetical protein TNCV_4802221 [Trichonephila clavipes]|nr:hypothetical protein TNCV_4802221 [Trichonephila clavipes]